MSDSRVENVEAAFAAVFQKRVTFRPDLEQRDEKAWDSLRHVQLMVEIEKRLGLRFDGAQVSQADSVPKILALIDRETT